MFRGSASFRSFLQDSALVDQKMMDLFRGLFRRSVLGPVSGSVSLEVEHPSIT